MFKQLIYITFIVSAFTSITSSQKVSVKQRKASVLYCDSATLKSYRAELTHDTSKYDSAFIRTFFSTINKFNGKPLDTTIVTTGKLDEMGNLCKIRTRIYYCDSNVYVESRLTINHKLLWKYSFEDPFHPFSTSAQNIEIPKLFDWQTRNLWVYFTAGVYDGPPEFVDYASNGPQILNGFPPDGRMVINNDISTSRNQGIKITEKQFRAYLRNFKGDLFTYGDFTRRECAFIWYSPAKRFILFYSP